MRTVVMFSELHALDALWRSWLLSVCVFTLLIQVHFTVGDFEATPSPTCLSDVNTTIHFTGAPYYSSVPEDTKLHTLLVTVSATAQTICPIEYTLVNSSSSRLFEIDHATGLLTSASMFDAEDKTNYMLTVEARVKLSSNNVYGKLHTANVTVTITDVNDNMPHFIGQPYIAAVSDATIPGTLLLSVAAADRDITSLLIYSVIKGDEMGYFHLDNVTGELTLAQSLAGIQARYQTFYLTTEVSDGSFAVLTTIRISFTGYCYRMKLSARSLGNCQNQAIIPNSVVPLDAMQHPTGVWPFNLSGIVEATRLEFSNGVLDILSVQSVELNGDGRNVSLQSSDVVFDNKAGRIEFRNPVYLNVTVLRVVILSGFNGTVVRLTPLPSRVLSGATAHLMTLRVVMPITSCEIVADCSGTYIGLGRAEIEGINAGSNCGSVYQSYSHILNASISTLDNCEDIVKQLYIDIRSFPERARVDHVLATVSENEHKGFAIESYEVSSFAGLPISVELNDSALPFVFKLNGTTAEFLLDGDLDHEAKTVYRFNAIFTATKTDGSTRQLQLPVTVNVRDYNDNSPEFSQRVYHANVSELSVRGHCVLQVAATDRDTGNQLQLFVIGNGHLFSINAQGCVVVAASLRGFGTQTISVPLNASDGVFSATTTVEIYIQDETTCPLVDTTHRDYVQNCTTSVELGNKQLPYMTGSISEWAFVVRNDSRFTNVNWLTNGTTPSGPISHVVWVNVSSSTGTVLDAHVGMSTVISFGSFQSVTVPISLTVKQGGVLFISIAVQRENRIDTELVTPQTNSSSSTANIVFLSGIEAVANSSCADAYVVYRRADARAVRRALSCSAIQNNSDIAALAVNSLAMQYAPRLQTTPRDYIIPNTNEAINFDLSSTVRCAANSLYPGDSGLDVLWYIMDGQGFKRVNSKFANFTSTNDGMYICQAQNYFGSVSSKQVHVELFDRPQFTHQLYTVSVPENAPVGCTVLLVSAHSTNYLPVVYDVELQEGDQFPPFYLKRSSGIVYVSDTIDSSRGSSDRFYDEYSLIVTAMLDGFFSRPSRSIGSDPQVGYATVKIKIVDINEFTPVFRHSTYSANVSSLAIPNHPLFGNVVFVGGPLQALDGDKTAIITFQLVNYTSLFSINSSSGNITAISSLRSYLGQTLDLTVKASDQDGKASSATVSVFVYDQCLEVERYLKLILNTGHCGFYLSSSSGMPLHSMSNNTTQWSFRPRASITVYYDVLKFSLSLTNIHQLNGTNNTGWIDVYVTEVRQQDMKYEGRLAIQQAESPKGDFVYWNIISPFPVNANIETIVLNVTLTIAGQTITLEADSRPMLTLPDFNIQPVYLSGNQAPMSCTQLTATCKRILTSFKQQEELGRLFGHQCIYSPQLFKPHLVAQVQKLATDCVTVNIGVPTPAVSTNPTVLQQCSLSSLPSVSATNSMPMPGSLVTLTCNLQGVNSNLINIVWSFEGQRDIVMSWVNGSHVRVISGSTLQITTMSAERQGRYSCCAQCRLSAMPDEKCSSVDIQGVRTFLVTLTINQLYNSDLDDISNSNAVSLRNQIFRVMNNSLFLGPNDQLRLHTFRKGSVVAEVFVDTVNTSLSSGDIQSQIAQSNSLDITQVIVKRFDKCATEKITDSKGEIEWSETNIGQSVTKVCPHGRFGNSSITAFATRECHGSYINGSRWSNPNTTNCEFASVVTRNLRRLAVDSQDSDNVTSIIGRTQSLTSVSIPTADDLIYVSEIVENVVANETQVTPVVFKLVVQTTSNSLVSPAEEVKLSQLKANASSRIIRAIENAAFHVRSVNDTLASATVSVTTPNVAVVIYINKTLDTFQGYTFASRLLTDNAVISQDDELQHSQIVAIPKSNALENNTAVEASIDIPPGALPRALFSRLQFFLYQNAKFFQPLSSSQSERQLRETEVNSRVIAAKLGSLTTVSLSTPASLSFLHFNKTHSNTKCAYWDFAAGGGYGYWSSSGCDLVSDRDGYSVCECDHLTNFAVLVDPYQGQGISDENKAALSVISYVGCSLSLVGLLLTAMAYGFSKRFRKERPGKILINLCISMALGLLFFIAYAENHGNAAMCTATAVLLHYFWLTAFCWMIVEGANMYLSLVRVIGNYVNRFMWKASAFAWGTPLLVVVVTVGADFDSYEKKEGDAICLLSTPAFYYAFYSIIVVLLLVNFTVFGLVMRELRQRHSKIAAVKKGGNTKQQLRAAVSISLLLGLSWVFAATGTATGIGNSMRLVFQYLFAVTVSVQGFLIFLVYCALREDVRKEWLGFICKGRYKSVDRSTLSLTGKSTGKTSGGATNPTYKASQTTEPTLDDFSALGGQLDDGGLEIIEKKDIKNPIQLHTSDIDQTDL